MWSYVIEMLVKLNRRNSVVNVQIICVFLANLSNGMKFPLVESFCVLSR